MLINLVLLLGSEFFRRLPEMSIFSFTLTLHFK
jgi:hypothetical protein